MWLKTLVSILLFCFVFFQLFRKVALEVEPKKERPEEKFKTLQIGIKKRVDNCVMKSKRGDVLHMHYTGALEKDGSEFDNSYKRGEPIAFKLGAGQVIRGWDEGLLGMCEGEKRKLLVPSHMGYGAGGTPPRIPGYASLVFEVELVKIERDSEL